MADDDIRAVVPPGEISANWETPCPAREDGIHCVHWGDGEACCSCGDPAQEGDDDAV